MSKPAYAPARFLGTLRQDFKYALRRVLKRPGFTAVAVITLALGIGANTAIFSVVNAILLRPLPFDHPERLLLVWQTNPGIMETAPTSLPNFFDWREQNQVFEELAAWASYTTTKFNLTGGDQPEQVQYALCSSNLFSTLGVKPSLGRAFTAKEEEPGGERVVMVSHGLWQRRFGSDPDFAGKSITLDGNTYTVVGVLPRDFRFVSFPKEADVWVPLGLDPSQHRRYVRSILFLSVVGRLKPGVSPEQAQANMSNVARTLADEYPENKNLGAKVIALEKQVVGDIRPALQVLTAAVGFVLLIACANVANLLLARAVSRQREMAVRAALGASRRRLVQQLLAESLLLSVLGGLAGLLLAFWGIRSLALIPYNSPSMFVPFSVTGDQVGLDGRVLGFTVLVSLLTGPIFGLVPSLQASKVDQYHTIKEGGTKGGGSARLRNMRGLLVVTEVALSVVLLIGAGLMIKSFLRLQQVDPGFDPENVLSLDIGLPRSKYPQEQQVASFYERLLEKVEALPGVKSVGAVTALPLSNNDELTDFYVEGKPAPQSGQKPLLHHRKVSPNYFRTLNVGVRKGREFTARDRQGAPPVVVINEAMARKYWPDEDPVGRRLALSTEAYQGGKFDLNGAWREVVGVVADVRHAGLGEQPEPEAYVPYLQSPNRDMTLVLRTASDPTQLAGAISRETYNIDKDQPVSNVRTMSQLLSTSLARPRFNFLLLTIFAGVALVLAAVGVYGVISYSVTQRTQEFGIRMALGAQVGDILRLVFREGMTLALVGIVIGLAGAFALTRYIASLLYGLSATDPLTFAGVSGVLALVAVLACYFPARRAVRIDPINALRYE
ncbi:MAG TPA: ABC transporter permease [Pyrinomonadaceae bacterium]|jgi:putative ABC transport system permease protein